MSTLFEQPSSNSFSTKNRGGIKRIKKSDEPVNFYQQIECNAEFLLKSFPQKDKLQLMKLLEDLDNQVEIAYEILNSEQSISQNNITSSYKIQQSFQNSSSDFEIGNNFINTNNANNFINVDSNKFNNIASKDILEKRKIVYNLKPKQIKKDGQISNQMQPTNQQNQAQLLINRGLQQLQPSQIQQPALERVVNFNNLLIENNMSDNNQSSQIKSQLNYNIQNSMNHLESKTAQNISTIDDEIQTEQSGIQNKQKLLQQQQKQANLKNQNLFINYQQKSFDQNDEDEQQSVSQEDDSQSSSHHQNQHNNSNKIQTEQQQQQQYDQTGANNQRNKNLNQISLFQNHLIESFIPQLLQQLGSSDIQQAPAILMQAFKHYEEENRRNSQYDKIISNNQILVKAIGNILKKNQLVESQNTELIKQNTELKDEKEKYRTISERLSIMFSTKNEQQQLYYNYDDFFDQEGNSGMYY